MMKLPSVIGATVARNTAQVGDPVKLQKWTALSAAAILACGLTACGGDSASGGDNDGKSMQVMMFPGVAYRLPVVVAQEKGFFDDEGLSLKVIGQPNNLQGIQALEATKSQAGMMSTTTFAQGVQAGSDVSMFCGGLRYAQSSLIAPADSDLPSVAEGATPEEVLQALAGLKVGAQTPVGTGFQLMLAEALNEAGVTDATWVNVGGSNSVTQASLQNDSVDVAQASPPGTQTLVENGVAKELIYLPDHSAIYKDTYGSGWVGPADWVEENADTAKAFCDATAAGLEYILDEANHDEVRDIFMKDTGVDNEEVADAALATYAKGYSADLPVDVIQASFDQYADLGITTPEPKLDATDLVDSVGR